MSRKCRHTRSGNEILEHLGPIYTWKISLKYRDILHQIEISLKYRVHRKKQYRSGVDITPDTADTADTTVSETTRETTKATPKNTTGLCSLSENINIS